MYCKNVLEKMIFIDSRKTVTLKTVLVRVVHWFLLLQETQEYTRNVVRYCLEALQDWFDAINFVDEVNILSEFKQSTMKI